MEHTSTQIHNLCQMFACLISASTPFVGEKYKIWGEHLTTQLSPDSLDRCMMPFFNPIKKAKPSSQDRIRPHPRPAQAPGGQPASFVSSGCTRPSLIEDLQSRTLSPRDMVCTNSGETAKTLAPYRRQSTSVARLVQ